MLRIAIPVFFVISAVGCCGSHWNRYQQPIYQSVTQVPIDPYAMPYQRGYQNVFPGQVVGPDGRIIGCAQNAVAAGQLSSPGRELYEAISEMADTLEEHDKALANLLGQGNRAVNFVDKNVIQASLLPKPDFHAQETKDKIEIPSNALDRLNKMHQWGSGNQLHVPLIP